MRFDGWGPAVSVATASLAVGTALAARWTFDEVGEPANPGPVLLAQGPWLVPDDTPGLVAVAGTALALGIGLLVRRMRTSAALARTRADFVTTATHELKTPVAAIRAAGETLLNGRLSEDARADYARLVVDQADRLTRLLNNVLAYSRITSATEAYTFEPLSLDLLVGDVLRDWRRPLERAGFTVHVDIPDDLPPVRADRTAFELLVDNLVSNAVTYSGDTRRLEIVARQADGRAVTLDIVDHGIGIAADEIEHVRRRFVRGRRAAPGGSGLGLAIADRIVHDHGGSLTIQSAVGAGTTVRVTLPAAEIRPS
jgi:two-component system phosphate regulon sensor histidine kinase PhoR